MNVITVGNTVVASESIPSSVDDVAVYLTDSDVAGLMAVGGTRHRLETAAVLSIVRRLLGEDVSIGHEADGSPVLVGHDGFVSISHSKTCAVVAINPSCRVGIDTETWREQLTRVVGKFLSEPEREVYTGRELLLRAWTIKEAVYKAAGIAGLSLSDGILLDVTDVSATVASVMLPDGGRRSFSLHFLPSPEGSATTLAVPL